jgi:regulator of vacuolar morphogenesis
MGIKIHDEVERQTEMLTMLDEDTDRVKGKLNVANNRIRKF